MEEKKHDLVSGASRPSLAAGRKTPPFPLSRDDPGAGLNLSFDLLAVFIGWIFHPIWILVFLWLILFAATVVVHSGDRILSELAYLWSHFTFLPLLAGSLVQTILVLNLPHSLLMGAGCRVLGGRVRAFKLTFYGGLIPVFHADLGDSLTRMTPPARSTFLWWNILFPLVVGAVATLAWAVAGSGSGARRFWLCMFAPCLLAFLLQCNIFMRLGLYWVLCSATGEWGLHERALAETRAWLDWGRAPEALARTRRYWFRFYGMIYYLYSISLNALVLIGGGWWLVSRFPGAAIFVYPALVLWYYRDALGRSSMAVKPVRWVVRGGGPWWLRWPLRLAGLAGLIWVGGIRYNYEIAGECRLFAAEEFGVRSQLTDEVVQVHVSEGDHVEAGTVIATLSARDATADYKMTERELERARANLDLVVSGPRKEDIEVASEQVEICQNQLSVAEKKAARTVSLYSKNLSSDAELEQDRKLRDNALASLLAARQELAKLTSGYREESIRSAQAEVSRLEERLKHEDELLKLTKLTAPIAGRVVTPNLGARRGIQAQGGELIAVVQDTSRLWAEVAADEAAAVEVRKGMPVKVRLYGLDSGRLLTGRVRSLAVTAEANRRLDSDPYRSDAETFKLQSAISGYREEQRVRVVVELDEYPGTLVPGMDGYARIVVDRDDVLWRALARPIVRFLRTEVWYWLP